MRFIVLASCFLSCVSPWLLASQLQSDPEAATGVELRQEVTNAQSMVVTANPHATAAAITMLDQGGSAVDAAIAAQLVLGLVEPQSSGIGGGLFLLHWSAATQQLTTIDGRETAPAAASPDWFVEQGKVLPWSKAFVGGKAVGTPGVIAALFQAHQQHGKLAWADLFAPAIQLAEQGFKVSPRLHKLLAARSNLGLTTFAESKAYFYPDGQPLPIGTLRKNQAYAMLLKQIAAKGPVAFYQGDNAQAIVNTVNKASINPGQMQLTDIQHYQPREVAPICAPYRQYKICGMAPPSSGSLAVLQILGILSHFDLKQLPANSEQAVHLISQASRLAFADRERYIADPMFTEVPVAGLLAPQYLKQRASLIPPFHDVETAVAGLPQGAKPLHPAKALEYANTSHLSIVAKDGSAVSMTTSIENAFGSGLMVNGYLLNNQLTDFALEARSKDGLWVANRVEAGKRPRSSMAPMVVFDDKGQIAMLVGSPGGSRIIDYVAQALVAMIDWQLGPQAAANLPKFTHRNDFLALEADTPLTLLQGKLLERGYDIKVTDLNSGLHLIKRQGQQWTGGADPRREGLAAGQTEQN